MKKFILILIVFTVAASITFGQNAVALCQDQVRTRQFEAARATCAEAAKTDAKIGQMGRGLALVGLADWTNAIGAFSAAIEADPRSAELFLYRGNANYNAGNYKAAAEDLSRASTLDQRLAPMVKTQLDASREIAELLPVKKASLVVERRSLEASLAANSLLIQRSMKVFNKASKEEIDALDRQIVEKIDESIRINRYNSHAYSTRASFYEAQRRSINAVVEYTKAIAIDPLSGSTYYSRGKLMAKIKNYPFAAADLSKAIELEPQQSSYYTERSDVYEKMGQKEKALQDLTRMIELSPKNSFGYNIRAGFYQRQNENEKALADLSKAVELDPKDASARVSRCRYYNDIKNYTAAVADCTVSIEQKSYIISDSAMFERAVAYTGLKKYDLALADLSTAEASGMISNAEIFAQRGVVFAAQGKKALATDAFNAALKEDPKNQKAINGLKAISLN